METIKKQNNIIIVGIQPWDISIGSNCKNIALELSKNHKILYVNAPLDRSTAKNQKDKPTVKKRLEIIKGNKNSLSKIQENIWEFNPPILLESINWLPQFLFTYFNKKNNKRFAKCIISAAEKLGFKDYYLINDSDMFRSFYLKEFLNPIKYLYYTRDNLMTVPYWKKHGQFMEPKLMAKADLVLGNSPLLIKNALKYNPNSFFIGQGCNLNDFSANKNFEKPEDLKPICGKIIGYTGLLSSRRLDINLIAHIAKSKPHWNIVLIGKEEDCFLKSELHELKNCIFLGNKSPDVLPSFISYFDVCINPQLVNELTLFNYPRKIDEYLAMGKPVVASYTPTMEYFSEQVLLANDSHQFTSMINTALYENNELLKKKRIDFAKTHSWEACIDKLWQAIDSLSQNKNE